MTNAHGGLSTEFKTSGTSWARTAGRLSGIAPIIGRHGWRRVLGWAAISKFVGLFQLEENGSNRRMNEVP
jgi:hypothetical protein